jgi:hypothetical protein
MAQKPKVGGAKKPPPKKMTPAEQSRAFIEKAREIGVDETGKEFDAALRRIAPPRRTTKPAR